MRIHMAELRNISVAIEAAVLDDLSLFVSFLGPDDHGRKGI